MAAARNEHLGVDYVVRKLPFGVRKGIYITMQVLVVLVMAGLMVQSKAILQFIQYQTTPVLDLSASWAFYSLPIGALGVLIISLVQAIKVLLGDEQVEEPSPSSAKEESVS